MDKNESNSSDAFDELLKERASRTHLPGSIYFTFLPYCGFGYPRGYRPTHASDIGAEGLEFALVAIREDGSHFCHEFGDVCKENLPERIRLEVKIDEFGWQDVERVISEYLGKPMTWESGEINLKEEMNAWREGQQTRLAWLREGAPPYALTFTDEFLKGSNPIEKTIAEEVKQNPAYKRTEHGLTQEAEKIINVPVDFAKAWFLDHATAHNIPGPIYVSGGTWPLPIEFVAGGRRYYFKEHDSDTPERAWLSYYPAANSVWIYPQCKTIRVENGEPDVLEALIKIRD